MKIAVASSDFHDVSGHAGRAKRWLVFTVDAPAPERIELSADQVFHHVEDGQPHPLDGVDTVIALSAGDGFIKHMEKRGAAVVLTAEKDAAKAVADYLAQTLSDPKPRPIGSLICKTIDLLTSKHK